MNPVYVEAFDIPDAWFKVVEAVRKNGIRQRLQAYDDWALTVYNLILHIKRPDIRPISCPEAGYTDGMINEYFANYFFGGVESEHEHNYGNRLRDPVNQYQLVANMLRKCPWTRRAVLLIPRPKDLLSDFAPCVRELQFYFRPESNAVITDYTRLWTTVFMRSWDTYVAGNPDIGSFQLAAEMVAGMVGRKTGPLTLFVTNAHIYKKSIEAIDAMSKDKCTGKTFYQKIKEAKEDASG